MRTRLIAFGCLSLLIYAGMAWLSQSFVYGQGHRQRPILEFLALYASAFVLYVLALAPEIPPNPPLSKGGTGTFPLSKGGTETPPLQKGAARSTGGFCRQSFIIVLAFAVLFRTILLFSNPIQEDDFYRYLWDGKVVASGLNPYGIAPAAVIAQEKGSRDYVRIVASDASFDRILSRVNHPGVATIYPPLAQGVFGLVALVAPGNLVGLRLVFFAFDLGICLSLIAILRRLGVSAVWVLVYAWSPLVIKETINSAHYDVMPTFFLVLAVLLMLQKRWGLAHGSLALAILGKLYPLLLLPLFVRRTTAGFGWARALCGVGIVIAVVTAGYSPFLDAGQDLWQGTVAFAEKWQTNSLVFPLLNALVGNRWAANGITIIALATALLVLLRQRDMRDDRSFLWSIFVGLGALFLLSPVGDPWYFVWLTPFLCLFPLRSWILLSGLLGLYYLSFYFMYNKMAETFGWIIWLEYAPFYGMLLWDKNRVSLAASFCRSRS